MTVVSPYRTLVRLIGIHQTDLKSLIAYSPFIVDEKENTRSSKSLINNGVCNMKLISIFSTRYASLIGIQKQNLTIYSKYGTNILTVTN